MSATLTTPETKAGHSAAGAADRVCFEGVSMSFNARGRTFQALQPINLSVKAQEVVAFVGPSGCGKSTLLNLTAGLLTPTQGRVTYNGEPIRGINRRVGYMTQKDTLLPWRKTEANVAIPFELRCRADDRPQARGRIAEMIKAVGLSGFEQHYPGELSGGMRKRVALARTLIYNPETLLMDEPFGALDAQLKLLMLDQLQTLVAERKVTLLFVTHDLAEAITLADRVLVFGARPGRIRASRDVDIPRPRDVFRIRFDPRFAQLYEELWDELKDEVVKGADV